MGGSTNLLSLIYIPHTTLPSLQLYGIFLITNHKYTI